MKRPSWTRGRVHRVIDLRTADAHTQPPRGRGGRFVSPRAVARVQHLTARLLWARAIDERRAVS